MAARFGSLTFSLSESLLLEITRPWSWRRDGIAAGYPDGHLSGHLSVPVYWIDFGGALKK